MRDTGRRLAYRLWRVTRSAGGGNSAKRVGMSPWACGQRPVKRRYRGARNVPCARPFLREVHDPEPTSKNPPGIGGSAYRPVAGSTMWQSRASPTSPIFASPDSCHGRSALWVSCFRAGCAATSEANLRSISAVLPALSGFSNPQSCAPWPVWRGSIAGPVRFAPLSRKQAARLWHAARRWDRATRQPGRHGGIIGRTALAAMYALLFDFLNHRTGRLDSSLDAIAAKAGCCRRAVVDALARLRDLGLLAWQRRCEETRDAEGRVRVRQRAKPHRLVPPSQWVSATDKD